MFVLGLGVFDHVARDPFEVRRAVVPCPQEFHRLNVAGGKRKEPLGRLGERDSPVEYFIDHGLLGGDTIVEPHRVIAQLGVAVAFGIYLAAESAVVLEVFDGGEQPAGVGERDGGGGDGHGHGDTDQAAQR